MKDEIRAAYLADNTKSRFMEPNGEYTRLPRRKEQKLFGAQDYLIARAEGTAAVEIPEPAMLPPRPGRAKKSRVPVAVGQ